MKAILGICLSILFCGCSAVYSPYLIGETPTNIEEEKSKWEGTWLHADGSVTVKVLNASKGILKIGWVDTEQRGLKYEEANVFLRDGGGWTFANFEAPDESNEIFYVWARIKHEENQVILWVPDEEKFGDLVEAEQLPGEVDGSDVRLEKLTPQHIDLITAETNGILFKWDEPMVFIKLSR